MYYVLVVKDNYNDLWYNTDIISLNEVIFFLEYFKYTCLEHTYYLLEM